VQIPRGMLLYGQSTSTGTGTRTGMLLLEYSCTGTAVLLCRDRNPWLFDIRDNCSMPRVYQGHLTTSSQMPCEFSCGHVQYSIAPPHLFHLPTPHLFAPPDASATMNSDNEHETRLGLFLLRRWLRSQGATRVSLVTAVDQQALKPCLKPPPQRWLGVVLRKGAAAMRRSVRPSILIFFSRGRGSQRVGRGSTAQAAAAAASAVTRRPRLKQRHAPMFRTLTLALTCALSTALPAAATPNTERARFKPGHLGAVRASLSVARGVCAAVASCSQETPPAPRQRRHPV
jgi:hypothetical protein